jgi:pantoate--beta-alanine ligase
MKVIKTVKEMQSWAKNQQKKGLKTGFVPTMGFFHEGHLSLMKASIRKADKTAVSIFVNPTQFGVNEDFDKYPRDYERDIKLAAKTGVDVVFLPSVKEMYPAGYDTFVNADQLSQLLEGKTRPTHFRGVCTVVLKLLNIVQPDYLFMGQKDIQQCVVLSRMINDLHLKVKMQIQPTMREKDGLAMSSRNTYLSTEERKAALALSKSLEYAKTEYGKGKKDASRIIQGMTELITSESLAKIDYIAIVDRETLLPIKKLSGAFIICLAVYIGKTRLIDNYLFKG